MRTAALIGILHGGEKSELIAGPEVPIHEQLAKFRKFNASDVNEKFGRVVLFFVDQPSRQTRRLVTEKEKLAQAEAVKKRDADAAKAVSEAEAKKKAEAEKKAAEEKRAIDAKVKAAKAKEDELRKK